MIRMTEMENLSFSIPRFFHPHLLPSLDNSLQISHLFISSLHHSLFILQPLQSCLFSPRTYLICIHLLPDQTCHTTANYLIGALPRHCSILFPPLPRYNLRHPLPNSLLFLHHLLRVGTSDLTTSLCLFEHPPFAVNGKYMCICVCSCIFPIGVCVTAVCWQFKLPSHNKYPSRVTFQRGSLNNHSVHVDSALSYPVFANFSQYLPNVGVIDVKCKQASDSRDF